MAVVYQESPSPPSELVDLVKKVLSKVAEHPEIETIEYDRKQQPIKIVMVGAGFEISLMARR